MPNEKLDLEELKKEVENWAAKIDELNAQAAEVDAELKAKYLDTVEELSERTNTLRMLIKDIERGQKSAWQKAMSDFERILSDLDENYRRTLEHFF